MKKSAGNDLMRIRGDQGTGNGTRRPPMSGINEELYQEDLYTDYSVEKPVIEPEEGVYNDFSNEPGIDYGYDGTAEMSRRKKGLGKTQLFMIIGIVVLLIVAVVCGIMLFNSFGDNEQSVKTDVLVEIGTPITLDLFFDKVPDSAVFLTDISGIDITQPAAYQLKIGYGNSQEADVVLRLEDHTGPTGEVIPQEVYLKWKMPDAKDCVKNLFDISGVAKIAYQEGTPKFTAGGTFQVPVAVTDVYGNTTVLQVPFTIIDDHTAPVIKGVKDLVLDGNPDQLNFYAGVTVTDDYDKEPVVKVDDSAVDYTKAGTYELVYRAIDKAGNIGTAKAKITINMPTEEITNTPSSSGDNGTYHVGDGDPYALASKVLSNIRKDSDVETARAIFNWVHDTFWFRLLSGTPDYEDAAYRGFTLHNGDCYVYYACCKMLLDAAGIPNMRVDRSPARNGNIHFWLLVQLNGEWYHCDATEGYNDHPGIWFMCTDDEINDQYHQFNGSLYPARAGGSKEFKTTATPTPTATPSPSVTVTTTPSTSVSPTPSGTPTGDVSPTPATPTDSVSPTPATPAPASPTPAEDTPAPVSPTPAEDTPAPASPTPAEDTPAPTTPEQTEETPAPSETDNKPDPGDLPQTT